MKAGGSSPDFFAALARKAVQAPGLQPRRASRFEEGPAARGAARWGADPAGRAEPEEGDGLGGPAPSPSPQAWARMRAEAAALPQGPVMPAPWNEGSPTSLGPGPSERALAQRTATAPRPAAEASAQLPWGPAEGLARPRDSARDDAGRSPLERRPARLPGQDAEATRDVGPARLERLPADATSRPLRMAELDRLEPAATEDPSAASRGPVPPSLASLKLQPLETLPAPREASRSALPERREGAVSASSMRPEAPAPQIEIHIGRIEVLPAGAPAPAAVPQPNPAQARAPQSLESYLAERRRR